VNYQDYISSPEWKAKAEKAKQRAGYRCQVCNSAEKLEAHHRTYENLGHENTGDITVLCHECHELFSKSGKIPTPSAFDRYWIEMQDEIRQGTCKYPDTDYGNVPLIEF
jgi:5-methylcytosine-specific restriction endonuclease McrA